MKCSVHPRHSLVHLVLSSSPITSSRGETLFVLPLPSSRAARNRYSTSYRTLLAGSATRAALICAFRTASRLTARRTGSNDKARNESPSRFLARFSLLGRDGEGGREKEKPRLSRRRTREGGRGRDDLEFDEFLIRVAQIISLKHLKGRPRVMQVQRRRGEFQAGQGQRRDQREGEPRVLSE